MGLYFD